MAKEIFNKTLPLFMKARSIHIANTIGLYILLTAVAYALSMEQYISSIPKVGLYIVIIVCGLSLIHI